MAGAVGTDWILMDRSALIDLLKERDAIEKIIDMIPTVDHDGKPLNLQDRIQVLWDASCGLGERLEALEARLTGSQGGKP